jgi:hypothetical protein
MIFLFFTQVVVGNIRESPIFACAMISDDSLVFIRFQRFLRFRFDFRFLRFIVRLLWISRFCVFRFHIWFLRVFRFLIWFLRVFRFLIRFFWVLGFILWFLWVFGFFIRFLRVFRFLIRFFGVLGFILRFLVFRFGDKNLSCPKSLNCNFRFCLDVVCLLLTNLN